MDAGAGSDPLRLPDDEELGRIALVREALAGKLDGLPEDLCDDVQVARFLRGHNDDPVARFLRGHNDDPVKAAEKMGKAVEYRQQLIQDEGIKAMRAASAEAEFPDLRVLPHAEVMLEVNPIFCVGQTTDELPVMVTCPRFLDFQRLSQCLDEKFDEYQAFLAGMLEQRAVVLHHLSRKHQRMCKFVDVRDLNQISVVEIIPVIMACVGKLKDFLGLIQNFYPEMIHQVVCLNAPNGLAPIFSLLGTFMNERMMSKIKIHPLGLPFHEVAQILGARAICNWVSEVSGRLCFFNMNLPNGTQEYCARWLEADAFCEWRLVLEEGTELKFIRLFIPAMASPSEAVRIDREDELITTETSSLQGQFRATRAGVLWLCVDNMDAWWTCQRFTLTINGGAVGLPLQSVAASGNSFLFG